MIAEKVDEGEHPTVSFTIVVPDERKDGREYVMVRDKVKRVDLVEKIVVLMSTLGYSRVNGTTRFECIISISGELMDMPDSEYIT